MTQGTLGADWIGALRDRTEYRGYQFVNAGINGNTSADLRHRVDTDIVACRPTAVLILIGTNDVREGVPLAQYRDNLDAIVDRVKTRTTARIAVMSLPPLGEDLDAEINQRLTGYNAVIKETAGRSDHHSARRSMAPRIEAPRYWAVACQGSRPTLRDRTHSDSYARSQRDGPRREQPSEGEAQLMPIGVVPRT